MFFRARHPGGVRREPIAHAQTPFRFKILIRIASSKEEAPPEEDLGRKGEGGDITYLPPLVQSEGGRGPPENIKRAAWKIPEPQKIPPDGRCRLEDRGSRFFLQNFGDAVCGVSSPHGPSNE